MPPVEGRYPCRSRHSSAVNRHSLFGVAHHQHVAVFGWTFLRGSVMGVLNRGRKGGLNGPVGMVGDSRDA
jgi:hypothetical protein